LASGWRGTLLARGSSAAFAVHAPQSHDTIARWAFAAGHTPWGSGETVGSLWPAPALVGRHRLSVRYLAADARHLPGMDWRDQPGTRSTLSPFQTRDYGTRPMYACAS